MRYGVMFLLMWVSSMAFGQEKELGELLDVWHDAAAQADLEAYMELIAEDGYYLGTDAAEVWTKAEFLAFCKPYFEKKETWAFDPVRRQVFLSEDKKMAWFEEVLDTWMGPCRGSGVFFYTDEGWKLKQYNLAVLLSNDHIGSYLQLIKERGK
ncbi:hypothetical protein BFP72_09150 [Reichenbachiella sp. 5M10]|uniref:nuclear transport factor 2 family protein n=1 Tax=Reichenbachiella sp. 5M10 TaxID=1889772 RepID=UPI000C158A24|nr:nuclear transport factor 2 family protein [Reichenbachiella sp. 5M10]PIB35545.1 hypothetical protein BFP72_09150 [Reichenbachiella sp. 5M10]